MNAKNETQTPRQLEAAAVALRALADDENFMIDCLCNDTAANFQAVIETVATCRDALSQIETCARERLAMEAGYHRDALRSIEALNVPLQSAARAAKR